MVGAFPVLAFEKYSSEMKKEVDDLMANLTSSKNNLNGRLYILV